MISVLQSDSPPDMNNITLTGGNGSDFSTNIAKAFIDIRSSNIFVVDISELANKWNIRFQSPLRETGSSNVMTNLSPEAEGEQMQLSDTVVEITILFKGITSDLRAGTVYFSNDLCPTMDGAREIKIDILFNEYKDTSALRFVCIGDRIVSLIPNEV